VGLAFKLEEGKYGQLTYMRVYSGTVKKGDVLTNSTNGKRVRVPRLVRVHSDELEDIAAAVSGGGGVGWVRVWRWGVGWGGESVV